MENLLFAAPQRKHSTKRKKSKKGKVRIIRITTIKYRVFRKTLRKKKKSKIFPTHVWFTDGSEKDYKIKGAIGSSSFYPRSSTDISTIQIGKSVTDIGVQTFYDCQDLESVTIPDSVKSIGEGAFANCWRLGSITIPASVNRIDDYVFDRCSSLNDITFDGMTMAQVRAMYDRFNLKTGTVIHCTDGDFTT